MRAVRPIAISTSLAITAFLIAMGSMRYADAGEAAPNDPGGFVIAQTSMGAPDPLPPSTPSAPPPRPDTVPPSLAPNQPSTSSDLSWGAIGFTADGSYSTTWKMDSRAEAEAKVAKKCAEFGRGGCEIATFSGQECVALATFIGSYKRRRWNLSFTAGGNTYPEAQSAAMGRCNSDERSQGRCQPRTAACADGR